jgi:hypothetical protein
MTFTLHDRTILRDLAKEVADIAADPIMARRKRAWIEHNSLRSPQPMMLIFPEGAWTELLPKTPAVLACHDEAAREIEWSLAARLYTFRHFQDDTVVEAEWIVNAAISDTGWGYERLRRHSDTTRGAYAIEPFLKERADLRKLRFPEVIYDEPATLAKLAAMQDLFGDILTIKRKGKAHISYHFAAQYLDLRGLELMFSDMVEAPDFVHQAMAFLEEGHRRILKQWVDLNLLSLNNDNTYHSSGGNGYTDELPAPGFNPARIRPADMWASAESQEMAPVSPRMHRDFFMQYEGRLLAPFGLTGYGCCEDLSRKLDDVLAVPHMRRVSISPFADVDRSAARLGGTAIFSWKPHPAHLVGDFDAAALRAYISHTLDVARANGCVLEMILKDTHTCEHHPERFDAWTRIAREEIRAAVDQTRAAD